MLGCSSLRLTPLWQRGDAIVLVPSMDAIGLRRDEGYEDVPVREALWAFDGMDRRPSWEIRAFAARAPLPRVYLHETDDRQLLHMIRQAIQNGWLIALRKGDGAGKPPSETQERRRLVGRIEQQTRGKLSHEGRQYKIVVDVDLAGVPSRDSYEVVGQSDARRVLDGLAKQAGTTGELAGLLGQASAKLTPDWRLPIQPDGLILLRRIVAVAAAKPSDTASVTPSQLKEMLDKAALVIHVVDLKQKPQKDLAFQIEAPDGSTVSGKLDEDGRGRAQSSAPGLFTVTFPDLDGDDWDGDGALDLSEDERSAASKYTVEQGDRLPTIGRDKGFLRWQTIWNFKGNADLRKLRGTAHILLPGDEVSIPSKVSREAEVPGGTAEYVVQGAAEVLRVCFAGITSTEDDPVTYKATPDTGDAIEGTLADDNKLEIDLPPDTTKVHVELSRKAESADDQGDESDDEPFASYDFTVGDLDPGSEVSGVQARLLNLGFYDGDITGELDDDTREAIAQFRWAKLRDRKDTIDDDFLAALNETHGA
jgi:hypothetical protein